MVTCLKVAFILHVELLCQCSLLGLADSALTLESCGKGQVPKPHKAGPKRATVGGKAGPGQEGETVVQGKEEQHSLGEDQSRCATSEFPEDFQKFVEGQPR